MNMMLEYAIRTDQSILSLIKMEQPQNASFKIKSKKLNIYVYMCMCIYTYIYNILDRDGIHWPKKLQTEVLQERIK